MHILIYLYKNPFLIPVQPKSPRSEAQIPECRYPELIHQLTNQPVSSIEYPFTILRAPSNEQPTTNYELRTKNASHFYTFLLIFT